jgi:hypothetical protein
MLSDFFSYKNYFNFKKLKIQYVLKNQLKFILFTQQITHCLNRYLAVCHEHIISTGCPNT